MKKFVFTSSLCLFAFIGIAQEKSTLSKGLGSEPAQTNSVGANSEDQIKIQQRKAQKEALIEKENQKSEFVKGSRPSTAQYDEKGRIIITRENYEKMTPERKKWISDQPDKYIVQ